MKSARAVAVLSLDQASIGDAELFFYVVFSHTLNSRRIQLRFCYCGGPSGKVVVAFPQHLNQARELSIFISKCKGLST